jgi:GAF domain-containing protein
MSMAQTTRALVEEGVGRPAEVTHLLEQVCEQIATRLGASSCALSHYDAAAGMVVTWITYAKNPEVELEEHLEVGETYHLDEYPATRRVLQEQVSLCIQRDDPQSDPTERAFLEKTGQQSLLMVPLVAESNSVGLLEIYQREHPRPFTPEEVALAQALTDQAALVIEGGHLFERAWQEARDLTTLMEANAAVIASLDLETVLRNVAEQMTHLIAVEECTFSRLDQKNRTISTLVKYLRGQATVGTPDQPGVTKLLANYPLTARVLDERVPMVVQVDDPEADPAERALLEEISMQSLLMLPVVAYERVVGLVELREGRQRRGFGPREVTLAQALANQAAIAIENARLFREREQRLAELAILIAIGQTISAPLNLDSLLETVHQQISRVFDATNFYIALYEEGSDEWSLGYHVEHGERQPETRHKLGPGITSHVIRARQPLLLRDVAASIVWDEEHGAQPVGERSKSWMGVPMISADKLVGVMAIQSYDREYLYNDQDLALFSTIATQVANALNNLQLLDETRRRAREMEALNEVGRAITSVLDLDPLLRQIVDIAKTRFGYYFACIALVEEDHLAFHASSTIGSTEERLPLEQTGADLRESHSLVGEAARTAKPVVVNDVLNDPRYLPVVELADTRAELDIPIMFQDRVIGVLDVQSNQANTFGEHEVAILQALVSQAGVAIENAGLFAERDRRITEMAILDEIGRGLASTLDLQQVTQAIHEQTGLIFDTASFFVSIYDEARQEWETLLDIIRGQHQPSSRYSVREGITGYIIRNRCALLFYTAAELRHFMEEQGVVQIGELPKSWLGVPMIAADHVVGTIAVESYDTEHAYSEADQALLSAVAAQAAIAIQNARLYTQIQQQVEELRQSNETQAHLWQQVQEMSTPVIPVQDRILVLPLVGTIDSERARRLTDRLLQAVRETRALVILLDITGVPVVDTMVAQTLIQCASAARLLGAEVVLVGVRSEVAQTLVTLEVGMEGLVTKSNLQAGIAYALGRVGLRIVPEEMLLPQKGSPRPGSGPAR